MWFRVLAPFWGAVGACARDPLDPVYQLLKRRIPHHDKFVLIYEPDVAESFFVDWDEGQVSIRGSSLSAITSGVHSYIKKAGSSIGWDAMGGDNFDWLEDGLPFVDSYQHVTEVSLRYYLNTCTYGYSMAFWNWTRWEKEIDWMALHGINAPLAMTGVEIIWKRVFERSFNVSVADFFVGPAFLPWHWMGNVDGWFGAPSDVFLESQRRLQHRILRRMRSLGMTPILPCFAGFVPKSMKSLFPSRVKDSTGWNTFPPTHYVEPTDSLFAEISRFFLLAYCEEYRCTGHYYSCDLYNEMVPPSSDVDYISNASAAVYKALAQDDKDAVWITQGWMFMNKRSFWQNPQIAAFISGVPEGKLVVIDLDAGTRPIFSLTKNFFGAKFIFSVVANFGGRGGMFGSIMQMMKSLKKARTAHNMIGMGVAAEAIELDPIVYEFFYDHVWTPEIDFDSWLPHFVDRRYGKDTSKLARNAWKTLIWSGIYDSPYSDRPAQTLCVRPSLVLVEDPGYFTTMVYHATLLFQRAVQRTRSKTLQTDTAMTMLQYLGDRFRDAHRNCIIAYRRSSLEQFEDCKNMITLLLKEMEDEATNGLPLEKQLTYWLSSASRASASESLDDQRYFQLNARQQISLWGPTSGHLADYAARVWGSGLTKTFYRPRWELWLKFLKSAIEWRTEFNITGFVSDVKVLEERWVLGHDPSRDRSKRSRRTRLRKTL